MFRTGVYAILKLRGTNLELEGFIYKISEELFSIKKTNKVKGPFKFYVTLFGRFFYHLFDIFLF